MSDITIYKVNPKDMRGVVELLKSDFTVNTVRLIKLLETRVESDKGMILLAKDDAKPVGILEGIVELQQTLIETREAGKINTLYVTESHRRQGIATKMLQMAGYWFASSGVADLSCDIPADDGELNGFFESQDYVPGGHRFTKQIESLD